MRNNRIIESSNNRKKTIRTFSLLLFTFSLACACGAAVTQRWTVETSRVQPAVFDAVHGETLELEAAFQSYGKAVAMPTNGWCILWQTNGMGSAWWQEPAEVERKVKVRGEGEQSNGSSSSTNYQLLTTNYVVKAAFTPAMDPGADTVIGFLGATGQNYRASFRIRFRHGPGERPNTIAAPVPILDLAHTTVINPPWPTAEDFAATTTVMKAELKDYVDGQIECAGIVTPQAVTNIAGRATSNVVTKAYVESLGISGGGITTNDVNAIIASSNLCTVAAAQAMTNGVMTEASGKFLKTTNEEYGSSISWVSGGLKISGDESWLDVGNYFSTSAGGTKVYGWDFLFDRNEESLQDALDEKLDNKDKLDWVSDTALRLSDAQFIAGNTTFLDGNGLSVSTWNNIVNQESTPYTLGGVLNTKANSSDVYTKTQIDGNAVTNGGAKAYADATFARSTTNYAGTIGMTFDYGSGFPIPVWGSQYARYAQQAVGASSSTFANRLQIGTIGNLTGLSFYQGQLVKSYNNSVVETNAWISDVKTLNGRVYDFDHGSNFTKRVYAALTNVIQTLGGTVANPPSL